MPNTSSPSASLPSSGPPTSAPAFASLNSSGLEPSYVGPIDPSLAPYESFDQWPEFLSAASANVGQFGQQRQVHGAPQDLGYVNGTGHGHGSMPPRQDTLFTHDLPYPGHSFLYNDPASAIPHPQSPLGNEASAIATEHALRRSSLEMEHTPNTVISPNAAYAYPPYPLSSLSSSHTQSTPSSSHSTPADISHTSPGSGDYYNAGGNGSAEDRDLEVADEEKKKRNQAASARFRQKKKLREQQLERQTRDLSEKASKLEGKITKLETENRFLKGLLTEKMANTSLDDRKDKD